MGWGGVGEDTEAGSYSGRTCAVSLARLMHVCLGTEKKHMLGMELRARYMCTVHDSRSSQMLHFVQYYFDFVRLR